MITEDYVSFETAKLLKEKGFKEITQGYINADKEVYMLPFQQGIYELGKKQYPYPTLQMAMKWLREIHSLHIQVFYDMEKSAFGTSIIPTMYPISDKIEQNTLSFDYKGITYEEACEAAIKYCLENLI